MAKIAFLSGSGNQTTLDGISRAVTRIFRSDGVFLAGDLAVTENDTPDDNVKVALGTALIGFDASDPEEKFYFFYADAEELVAITANSSGNDRIDAIVAYVDTANPGPTDNDGAGVLAAIEGTPAASPTAPTDNDIQTELGAGIRWIRLADVDVANGFSSILDADITDQRERVTTYGNAVFTNNEILYWENSIGDLVPILNLNSGDNMDIGGAGIGLINFNNATVHSGDTDLNNNHIKNWDGWVQVDGAWTYSSFDATYDTGVITVPTDATTKYSVGMRIKISQSTGGTKYGIITAVAATTLTVYFGTDYTLNNEAISSPYFSHLKVPFGFPADPTKWTVAVEDTSDRTQSNPTANTWYNPGSVSINIPIGIWDVSWQALVGVTRNSNTTGNIRTTLSTANNTESDDDLSCNLNVDSGATSSSTTVRMSQAKRKVLTLASGTPYFLNINSISGISTGAIGFYNSAPNAHIRAVCALL